MRANLNMEKPFLRGLWVKFNEANMGNVILQYEKLHVFCYMCGMMGHGEKDCEK